jgi:rhodanese-related sulfurtransferase
MKIKKLLVCIEILILICFSFVSAADIIKNKDIKTSSTDFEKIAHLSTANYSNITVYEAWDLLNDTSNGIQIPVDVRRDDEWEAGFIDTPYPESPIHYILSLLQTPDGLNDFIELYNGSVIIFYCAAGGRSLMATKILAKSNFTGTIYNMLGGIGAWRSAGLPDRTNKKPEDPEILGPSQGRKKVYYTYIFNSIDPDNDGVRYYIDWGDASKEWTEFSKSGKPVVKNHAWNDQGTYIITCLAQDFYGSNANSTSLTVTIPKEKTISFSFLRLFYRTIYFQIFSTFL